MCPDNHHVFVYRPTDGDLFSLTHGVFKEQVGVQRTE